MKILCLCCPAGVFVSIQPGEILTVNRFIHLNSI